LIGHFKNPREYNAQSIMPSYSYLSDRELEELTDYVQSLGAWKVTPDPTEAEANS
jgi:cbb3-type cytochrome oxidase cytochrome c subunit